MAHESGPVRTGELRDAVGQTLVTVALNGWFRVADPAPPEEATAPAPATTLGRQLTWLPRLADGLLSKGTDLAVGSVGSLALLLLAGVQRSV